MAKKLSMAKKIRRMLDKGYAPKEISTRLGCTAQQVYNIRWYDNKVKGIGSLPAAASAVASVPAPAAPKRPRGRPRKNPLPATTPATTATIDTSDIRIATPTPGSVTYMPAQPIPTQRSLWQRVKERVASVWR